MKDSGGAWLNRGFGERSCESLLGEALSEGVADTRFLVPISAQVIAQYIWKRTHREPR